MRILEARPDLWKCRPEPLGHYSAGAAESVGKAGSVRGLKARGGFIVDMEWSEGILTSARVISTHGRVCRISCSVPLAVKREDGSVVTMDEQGSFETVSGGIYLITPATSEGDREHD